MEKSSSEDSDSLTGVTDSESDSSDSSDSGGSTSSSGSSSRWSRPDYSLLYFLLTDLYLGFPLVTIALEPVRQIYIGEDVSPQHWKAAAKPDVDHTIKPGMNEETE